MTIIIRHLPLLDKNNKVVGLETTAHIRSAQSQTKSAVVLMAGGEGKRLRPLTENTPKPMLHIGDRPILQRTIEQFLDRGFSDFYIAVNYKADVITDYFENGSEFGCDIQYIHEKQALDTAGALSLFTKRFECTIHCHEW